MPALKKRSFIEEVNSPWSFKNEASRIPRYSSFLTDARDVVTERRTVWDRRDTREEPGEDRTIESPKKVPQVLFAME